MPKINQKSSTSRLNTKQNSTQKLSKISPKNPVIKRRRKKSIQITGKATPLLQSSAAIATAKLSEPGALPPSVQGPLRGTFMLQLSQMDWRLPTNPPENMAVR